jgi:drug/metabolite transporter (DMT)-like permease
MRDILSAMQPELVIALVAGLGGMLGWGLADFFAKKTIDAVGDVVSLVWAHIFGTLVLAAVALYHYGVAGNEFNMPDAYEWIWLAFFGVLQAAVYLYVYAGFAKGQVAVLSPIFASFSGLVALASVLFLGEVLGATLLWVLALIFIGVMLSSIDIHVAIRGSFIMAPGVREVVFATVLATLWTLLWDRFVGGADWIMFTLCMYAFMTLAMYAVARKRSIQLKIPAAQSQVWKFLFLIGACEIVAYLAISYGYSATTLTSVVAVLSGAFSLPVIILARMFLAERPTMTQTIGSCIVILGVILLPLV